MKLLFPEIFADIRISINRRLLGNFVQNFRISYKCDDENILSNQGDSLRYRNLIKSVAMQWSNENFKFYWKAVNSIFYKYIIVNIISIIIYVYIYIIYKKYEWLDDKLL